MPLLTSNDYPAIRKAIHGSVTEALCPVDLIEQDRHLWSAETWVASRVDVTSLSGDDLKHARLAALNYCASRLALVVTVPRSESSPAGSSYSQEVMSPQAKSRQLEGDAETELAFLTKRDETCDPPPRSGSARNVAVW